MSSIFQLPVDGQPAGPSNPFLPYGLDGNPFPDPGLDSGVLYTGHMKNELMKVNSWIKRVHTEGAKSTGVPPLALFGSLGVGKTHLLKSLHRGLGQNPMTPVLRKGISDDGMTRLLLSRLLLRYLPVSPESRDDSGAGLIHSIQKELRKSAQRRKKILGALGGGSPLQAPMEALATTSTENRDDGALYLSRWLRREHTTAVQRAKLRIGGRLESEGTAVRAIADLLRIARAAGLVQVWFVMLDQLEDLWRPGVITPSRRARFLTDLRHLIDQSLEGAPIALLLAWNTTVSVAGANARTEDKIATDYQALWQRLGAPIDLPLLPQPHVWPFAEAYLNTARPSPDHKKYEELVKALKNAQNEVTADLSKQNLTGQGGYAPRRVLGAWREKAAELASAERS